MIYVLIAILGVLNLLDAVTTMRIIAAGGRELNPVLRWLFQRMEIGAALALIKGFLMAVLIGVVIAFPHARETLVYVYAVLVVVYAGIVGNNVVQYRKQ